jgi:hypothetical protein
VLKTLPGRSHVACFTSGGYTDVGRELLMSAMGGKRTLGALGQRAFMR